MEINEQKREKFMNNAGKRVNNILHNIEILEPMARSNSYDFTKDDVEEMFDAIQVTLNETKQEFYKKFDGKFKNERKAFVFGQSKVNNVSVEEVVAGVETENNEENNEVVENNENI